MKLSNNRKSTNHTQDRGEFASILEESRWETFFGKIKPIAKVALPVLIIFGVGIGIYSHLNPTSPKSDIKSVEAKLNPDDDKKALSACIAKAPAVSTDKIDSRHYETLIENYNYQLGCYQKYPNINQDSKLAIEKSKQDATERLANLNGTTNSNISSEAATTKTTAGIDPETGCSYGLSKSAYSSCVDAYLAKKYPTNSAPSSTTNDYSSPQTTYQPPTETTQTPTQNTTTQPVQANTQLQECLAMANEWGDPSQRAWHQRDCHQRYGY